MSTPAISLEMPSSRSVTWRVQPPRSSRICDAENGNLQFATVPWSVGGGTKMSGFCNSIGMLRGPGSVPPRPGRIGCGGLPCPVVCALAAAVTRPAAAVLRTVRREGAMALSFFVAMEER